ncbi:hypothetical protein DPSP01_006968 [Paraphaeosphaeria sporulosa]|uniref:Rhodopsin domain-containing protein n=1 Tax=Paraphaeosphaeria sporulosa TaxID=1460663 RepID=A0A177CGA7_9PLEO|nr:uncharacterized protein CC84DRAFT_609901 [Paraphaeosphaeria sporulosa]OAG06624.1 hypothetical protein CC84DRAFT_609901 [Paraphaeosphaeria sporulosa]
MMHSSYSVASVVCCAIFTFLAVVAVLLRQYAQSLKKQPMTADAWFLLAGLIIIVAHGGLIIYGAVDGGLGWPIQDLKGSKVFTFRKVIWASQVLWVVSITLVRLGLLFFYKRVFPTPKFKIADNILIAFTTCWGLTSAIGTLAAYRVYQFEQPINYPVWLLVNSILNFAQDVATLCLPLPVIKNLHISRTRKFLVAGIFGLGFFSIIASIVRTVYFRRLMDLTPLQHTFSSTTVYCTIWSIIEPCNSLIAACLPALAPLLRKEHRGLPTVIRSMFSMVSLRSGSNRSGGSRRLAGESATDLTQGAETTTRKPNKLHTVESQVCSDEYEMGRPQ